MTLCVGCQKEEASRLECPTCKNSVGVAADWTGWAFLARSSMIKLVSKATSSHKAIHNLVKAAAGSDESDLPPAMRGYKYTGEFRPKYPLSPTRIVPSHIARPDYADHPQGWSEIESVREKEAKIYSKEEIETMRKVCRLTREVLDILASHLKVGITTDELDAICHEECIKRDCYPSPLNYNGFPKSVCLSVNDTVCHGIPDQRPLKDGDIVNIDVSLYYNGMHGDCNDTYPVGNCDEKSLDLISTVRQATAEAIALCKPGVAYREIGNKIQEICDKKGYGVVRTYTGHGIGQRFHTIPNILHYASNRMPGRMAAGQIFSIEPMINASMSSGVKHLRDDWTALTLDGARSAQAENTILITETGAEILTRISASAKKNQKKKNKKAKAAANGTATPEEGANGEADEE